MRYSPRLMFLQKFNNLKTADVQDSSFEEMIKGFDESYKPYLRYLHTIHPNWKFTPMNTGLDFNTSVIEEKNSALSKIYPA